MFKALMGGGRSSSDARSSRRKKSSSSSTVSRKSSSRGDDRDRGLGDLSVYPSSGSRSRSARYAESAAGESVASSYATAQPNFSDDRVVVERAPRRRESEYDEREERYRDERERERKTESRRERERTRSGREDSRDRDTRRRERDRTHTGDSYLPPLASGAVPAPVAGTPYGPASTTQNPSQPPFPMTSMAGPTNAPSPSIYDPHVEQQFPGQFPTTFAEPYRPSNPAGEAADYYDDQGQSVAEQPGVRPQPPLVIPNSQAHLMTASPTANPPPEPSSQGELGAAAAYYTNDPGPDIQSAEQPIAGSGPRPPRPPKPSKPSWPSSQAAGALGATAAAAAATYGVGHYSSEQVLTESPSTYVPPVSSSTQNPLHVYSHGVGVAVGAAAAGAVAGNMLNHHHHSSSSSDHVSQYTMQNLDNVSQIGPGYSGPSANPALYAAGVAGVAYAASPLHPDHAAVYHGSPFQDGAMAFQQRQRGPLDKFIDFWRDPEGVGKFEDYTEAIGVCKYCFEPGTTSKDAPRSHHYRRRRSSDRITAGSRVDKLNRYASSEDEGRRRKSSKSSWLPAILGGYAVKSLFDNKDFDDTYSVKSGRVLSASHDSESTSTSDKRSKTSRGVYKQSYRSRSHERTSRPEYPESRSSGYEGSRVSARPRSRSRSRSRSSSRSNGHTLRDAAIGAAIGTAAVSVAKSRHRSRSQSRSRSRSPRKRRNRKSSSSSDSSFVNLSNPAKYTGTAGFGSFFTASSENRKKRPNRRRKSIFSFTNSSSSSLDNDLAFGSGYARKLIGKSKKRSSKEKKKAKDVDAKLLALGATATALAASSRHRNRRRGEVFVGQGSRSGRSDYTSSASNEDGWEDMDSEDQASSVSSGLTFGASGHFTGSSDDAQSSDSSSRWGWGWGTKSKKKKAKRRSRSPENRFPTGAAVAAGELGAAALASGYHRDANAPSQAPSSSTVSLQHVAPVPTSDPSHFNAIPVSSFPAQPPLVRPGPIPLQQPQPVAPVSQAVYTTQGAPIPPFSAPIIPAYENPFPSYQPQSREATEDKVYPISSRYSETVDEVSAVGRRHQRSDSTPVFHTDPLESTTGSNLKRRSTTKDQASVQFDLTQEQEDREWRAERLEKLKRESERDNRIQLIDREEDIEPRIAGYDLQRSREREPEWEQKREQKRERERQPERHVDKDYDLERDRNSSSWAGPIAAGAIGAAAAATVLSGKSSNDDASETSEKRRERREQRRAERRRATEPMSMSSVSSVPTDLPERPKARDGIEQLASSTSLSNHIKTSAFRGVGYKKPVYDDYATFFYPEELRHSPDSHSRQGTPTMPTIIEIEPASESSRKQVEVDEKPEEPLSEYRDYKNLPWPVPVLKVIEPTPPHSVSGSVRDAASPIITPSEPPTLEKEPERPTASRVSWGEHQTHEYEVPSTSSERDSIDLDQLQRDFAPEDTTRDTSIGYTYIAPSASNAEVLTEEIEFAATVAAAAQAAGFDPSLITDDPIFRTRTSPPSSDIRDGSISATTKAPLRPSEFHGFVEGEVESSETPKGLFFRDQPLYTDPESAVPEYQGERSREIEAWTSVSQPVVKQLDRASTEALEKEEPSKVTKDIQEKPVTVRQREDSESPEEEFAMPGGFESEESPKKSKQRSVSPEDKTRELEPLEISRADGADADLNDVPASPAVEEDGSEGKKKKRRKRRSKRDSETFDDASSVTSSVVTTGDNEKRRSADGKKSGGFLSSIFGSRMSEPGESKRSIEKPVSREVQSEVGPRTSEGSTRRRRHRSSSRGESLDETHRFDDGEDSLTADKENINVESYKSSRQRREDRRKQRYGEAVGLGEAAEYEKDRRTSQDSDRDQSFLVERPEVPPMDGDVDCDGAPGPSSSMDPVERGLALMGPITRRPRSHSASPPSSQKIVTDSAPRSVSPGPALERGDDGASRFRRPSILRFADSPTAVPLHFRQPPTSPRLQRSPSVTSPTAAATSPGSPTQGRRSRPNSVEFKHSREIRPLFLVERHGSSKIENQFDDEPLPSLPSSKPSSASASVEDLTVLRDENAWELGGLNGGFYETQQPIEYHLEHDILGSQNNTPTPANFGLPRHPSRKEELGYEFHSPSELLHDPIGYPELSPSPIMGTLPSIEGSALGVKDDDVLERDLEYLPPLPESRPSTPEDKVISISDVEQTTPTQKTIPQMTAIPGLFTGSGFAGVVDAAAGSDSDPFGVPFPATELLENPQVYTAEDDDGVRTVTGDDVPVLMDVSPPTSPITMNKGLPGSDPDSSEQAGHWGFGFASVVGAAVAGNKVITDEEETVLGGSPVLVPVPHDNEKGIDDVADTTEDEFFDATGTPVESVDVDESPGAEGARALELEPAADTGEPSTETSVAKEAFEDVEESKREAGLYPEPESVKTEEEPIIPEPERETTNKSAEEIEATEAQPEEPAPETESLQASSLKRNKKKKKKKGKSVDASAEAEEQEKLPETETSDPVLEEPAALEEKLLSEQVVPSEEPVESERSLKVEEGKLSDESYVVTTPEVAAEISASELEGPSGSTPVLEEVRAPEEEVTSEQAAVVDREQPSEEPQTTPAPEVSGPGQTQPPEEASAIPAIEEAPAIEAPSAMETELETQEPKPENTSEATETRKSVESELPKPEEAEETPAETGQSKKAKKKKKKKTKAAAAQESSAEGLVEEASTQPSDSPVPETSEDPVVATDVAEPTEATGESTRSIEDVAQPESQEGPGSKVPMQVVEVVEGNDSPVSSEDVLQSSTTPRENGGVGGEQVATQPTEQASDTAVETVYTADESTENFQDPTVDKELPDLEKNDENESSDPKHVDEEPVLQTEDIPADRELTGREVEEPKTEPEQKKEVQDTDVHLENDKEPITEKTTEPIITPEPDQQVQDTSSPADIAVPSVETEALPESTESRPENDAPQADNDTPLARKASKKKKKNKRKSTIDALPEPEPVDTTQPEISEKAAPEIETELVLPDEESKSTELEDIIGDDKELSTEAVKDEEAAPSVPEAVVGAKTGDPQVVEEPVPEEAAEDQPKKTGKKGKKNRKSISLSEPLPEPESEPETKPEEPATEDATAPLPQPETSGQEPPLDPIQQKQDAGTSEESADAQTVDPIFDKVENNQREPEPEPSQPVENLSETNDSEPHVPEKPAVEPDAGDNAPSSGKKSKKNKKKKKQSALSTPEETSIPDLVEGLETPATEVVPGADVAVETSAAPEEPSVTPVEEPGEEISRDMEVPAESVEVPDEGVPQQEQITAPPMTAAQKKKAKKDKKKKRQSTAAEEESLPSELVAGTDADAPAEGATQDAEVAKVSETESPEAPAATPVEDEQVAEQAQESEQVTEYVPEPVQEQVQEQTSAHIEEPVQEQTSELASEQIKDEGAVAEQPVDADETTEAEVAESEQAHIHEAEDVAIAVAPTEDPATTNGQAALEQQDDMVPAPETPTVAEETTEPVTEDTPKPEGEEKTRELQGDVAPMTDDQPVEEQPKDDATLEVEASPATKTVEQTTVTQEQKTEELQIAPEPVSETPTEESQPTSSKKDKKKKKKKKNGQSLSVDETETTPPQEEDASESLTEPVNLPTSDAPVTADDATPESAVKDGEVTNNHAEPAPSTTEESQEVESAGEPPVIAEESPAEEQPTHQDKSVPELTTEMGFDQLATSQQEDTPATSADQDAAQSSLPADPVVEPAEPQEQEQPTEPAEPTQTGSSKKKDKKKKKKKSLSASLDDDQPAPAPSRATEEPAPEQPTESITEGVITAEPEEIAAGVEEPQPPVSDSPAPDSESKEPETQDDSPAEEMQTATSIKKDKKNKKKRKSLPFATEESLEQPAESPEPAESAAEPTVSEPAEATEPEPHQVTAVAEAPIEQADQQNLQEPIPSDMVITEEPRQDQEAPAETLTQAATEISSDDLDKVKETVADQTPSEELPKDEPAVAKPKKDAPGAQEAAQVEPVKEMVENNEAEPSSPTKQVADITEPEAETPKSKKDKKKKKKRKTLEVEEDDAVPPEPSENNVQPETEAIDTPAAEVEEDEATVPTEPTEYNVQTHTEIIDTPVLDVKDAETTLPPEVSEDNAQDQAEPIDTPTLEVKEAEELMEEPIKQEDEPRPAKARKKAKKDKKRQTKILALENEATETPQEASDEKPQSPVETVAPEASEEQPSLEAEPAETAIPPAEDDGKDNQSHDTELHGTTDNDLTWTDNNVSSQVEQQQQTTSDPFQPERESIEPGEPITAGIDVVEVGKEPVSVELESSADATVQEEDVNTSEVVSGRGVNDLETGQEQEEEGGIVEKEEPLEVEKVDEPSALPEITKPVEEQKEKKEEVISQPEPQPEAEAVKEAEPSEPAADVEAPEFAVPSRKLSKKQKKKQRQAQMAAELQEQVTEPTVQDIREVEESATVEEQPSKPPVFEVVQNATTLPVEGILPEQATEIPESSKNSAESATADNQPSEPVATEVTYDTTTLPDNAVEQADGVSEARGIENELAAHAEPDTDKDRVLVIPTETTEDEPVSFPAPTPAEESAVPDETLSLDSPKEEAPPAIQDEPEDLPSGKSKKKNKKNKKKAAAQASDQSDGTSAESLTTTSEPVVQPEVEEASRDQEADAAALEATGEEQPEVVTTGEEDSQPQIPEPSREEEPLVIPEVALEIPSEDKTLEPSVALEEPAATETLSRKESKKKKKKAKKQAAEQLERSSAPAVTQNAVEDVAAEVKPADVGEGSSLLVEEGGVAKEEEEKEEEVHSVQQAQNEPELVEAVVAAAEVTEEIVVARELQDESVEPATIAPEKDISSEVPAQEKEVTEEIEKGALQEKSLEQEVPTEIVEPITEKDILEAAGNERSQTPEPAPMSRKLSKKEKRKLKKQAESGAVEVKEKEDTEEPTEPVGPIQEDISISGAAEVIDVKEQDTAVPEAPAREDVSIPQEMEKALEESKDLAIEQPEQEAAPLSRKASKKEKRRKHNAAKDAEVLAEGEPVAQFESLPEEQLYDKFHQPQAEASDVTIEVDRAQDDDAWPPIDWAKGKIDTIEQSSQSSVEARAGPFEPEIPEFKESAIPEALMERSGNSTPRKTAEASEPPGARTQGTGGFSITPPELTPRQSLRDISSSAERTEPKQSNIASIFPNLERGFFRRPSPTVSPSRSEKDGAEEETMEQEAIRDSAVQVLEAPIATREIELRPEQGLRDSGYIPSPPLAQDDVFGITTTREIPVSTDDLTVAGSKPEISEPKEASRSIEQGTEAQPVTSCELRRSPSIHERHGDPPLPWSLDEPATTERGISPARTPLQAISEQEPANRATVRDGTPRLEMKPEHILPRPETPTRKFTENALGRQAWPRPDNEQFDEEDTVQKRGGQSLSPERGGRAEILKTPEQNKPVLRPSKSSSEQSLRRVLRSASGDLRTAALAAAREAPGHERQSRPTTPQPSHSRSRSPTDLNVEKIASSSSYDPVTDKGKRPLRSMTDVYEGWGETPTSPRSPSRPPSVRHRRSMQHLQELEFRLDHLIEENRQLAAARDAAEDKLRNASLARRKSDHALNTRVADLRDREAELEQLKQSVEWFQKEVARLNEENTGLATANSTLIATHAQEIESVRQSSAREVDHLRAQNEGLSSDLHERIHHETETALKTKNAELRRLREELESARDKVKELQQQIAASMQDNVIALRGEDYFEAACQKLCGHVQQWVLRFSKHSDHRRCRKLVELQDEKVADRFDNAILDGSDTDAYLGDRVRRRDVFMSVVMTMVWEFIFTRYLFGMDREQRQKLKSLEKQLIEVGPRNAIHRWRATTLTLLSRRPAFAKQRESDTEAVALEIFDILSRLLPPPSQVEAQLLESLRKVLRVAVNLSIDMRTQLAEFIMLPPLQPEYDTNGDLARQVLFNASLMNERSGETTSNEELQSQQAVVRIVLFPLVVKKGNDAGEGDDEVVVCPAQVLVARPGKDRRLSKMASGDRMSIEASRSVHSIAPSTMDMSMNMSMSNVI